MIAPYYQDTAVTLYHGDCADILPALGVKANLILTSPPYDNLRTYGGHGFDFDGWQMLALARWRTAALSCGLWQTPRLTGAKQEHRFGKRWGLWSVHPKAETAPDVTLRQAN